jgi:hypothetical protein
MSTALYTVCNEYEEIRSQILIPTKSLGHLKYAFDSMREAYNMYGHEQPQIFFTDNVQGDKKFLEGAFSSLTENTVPVPQSILAENLSGLPLLELDKDSIIYFL